MEEILGYFIKKEIKYTVIIIWTEKAVLTSSSNAIYLASYKCRVLDSDGINTYTIFIVLASFYRLIMQNAAYMK